MKYQQFKWRKSVPGRDYPATDALIEGPPSALTDRSIEEARPDLGERSSKAGRGRGEGALKITGASYIHIPLAHSAILVLTGEEYARAVLRGKVERGEPRDLMTDGLAQAAEALASVRLALEAERARFGELESQVKERVRGLRVQIGALERAPADFIGKTWKSWGGGTWCGPKRRSSSKPRAFGERSEEKEKPTPELLERALLALLVADRRRRWREHEEEMRWEALLDEAGQLLPDRRERRAKCRSF